MLLALVILLVVFVVVATLEYRYGRYPGDAFGSGVLATFLAFVILVAIFMSISKSIEVEPIETRQEVISLKDDVSTSGNISGGMFVLIGTMSGEVSEDPIYIYYSKDDKGGIRQQRHPVDDVVLYEEAGVEPYVVRYHCPTYNTKMNSWWTLGSTQKECNNNKIKDEYELHVPPGTVVRDFRLDAE